MSPSASIQGSVPSASPPSWTWRVRKALEGTDRRRLSRTHVPLVDLTGKWVVISGANSGIGREAALFFAECGANLVLACRRPPFHETYPADVASECEARSHLAGHISATVEWWEIDMARLSSVQAFVDRWLGTDRPLDILCNNAGIGGNPGDGANAPLKTEDGFEIVHQVNLLSHCLLTLRLLPSLQRARQPRVVCTTSCAHFFGSFDLSKFNGEGCSGEEFYCNNKLYLQVWLTELQHRLTVSVRHRHITVNGVHPGYTNTGIWHVPAQPGWANWVSATVQSALAKLLASTFAISAEQGSYAITNAAVGQEVQSDSAIEGVGKGRYYNRIWISEAMPYCDDTEARQLVWDGILQELGLQEMERLLPSTVEAGS